MHMDGNVMRWFCLTHQEPYPLDGVCPKCHVDGKRKPKPKPKARCRIPEVLSPVEDPTLAPENLRECIEELEETQADLLLRIEDLEGVLDDMRVALGCRPQANPSFRRRHKRRRNRSYDPGPYKGRKKPRRKPQRDIVKRIPKSALLPIGGKKRGRRK